jgi:hypothetical protein
LRIGESLASRTETPQVRPEVEIGGVNKSQRHLLKHSFLS